MSHIDYNPELGEGHELHAWVEYYVPGAGWIGIDPSAGIYITEVYIPASSSYFPQDTLPVTGNYKGNAVSELDTSVMISVLED